MLLVAGKKMDGWSEVEKASGPVPAAEVAPYTWAHRFLPHEAKKVSGGGDARDKVPLPWLNLVATGGVTFKWTRFDDEMTITEGGKRALHSGPHHCGAGAIAEPQVAEGSHYFEVQILEPGRDRYIEIGWSAPGVEFITIFEDEDEGKEGETQEMQHTLEIQDTQNIQKIQDVLHMQQTERVQHTGHTQQLNSCPFFRALLRTERFRNRMTPQRRSSI